MTQDAESAMRQLVREVAEAAPGNLDVTPASFAQSVAGFGFAEAPSGSRRVLLIRVDWKARRGGEAGALRWELCDASGYSTDGGPVGDGAVATIIAAMEKAVR